MFRLLSDEIYISQIFRHRNNLSGERIAFRRGIDNIRFTSR